MTPSNRLLTRLLTLISAAGLFLLVSANPFAQSTKLPAPSTHVSDFAGVIDSESKTRLDSLLQKLQEKSKVELYVATVDNTGAQGLSDFSKQLATDWNIGAKTSRTKSVLLVVSTASKTSFTQVSRAVQTSLPDGVVGDMGYRMSGPLGDGRFTEAIDGGVHVFANAVADKIGFKLSDLEGGAPVAANSPEVAVDTPQPVRVSAKNVKRSRRVTDDAAKQDPQPTPPVEAPRIEPTPTESPVGESSPAETPKPDPVATESSKTEDTPAPKSSAGKTTSKKGAASAKTNTPVTKKTAAEIAEQDADESEEVELTLTKPYH